MIQDQRIDWMRKRLFLTALDIQGIDTGKVGTAVTSAWETAGVTADEVTNVGMGTYIMTDTELLNGYIPCPYDLDPKFNIGFGVHWTADHDGTGALTSSWILLQDAIKIGEVIALPATALNTIIPLLSAYNDENGVTTVTDFRIQKTGRGIRDDIGLNRAQIEAGAFITFKLELDAAINETSIRFIGLEMDYVPMMTVGNGPHTNRPLQSNGVA